MKIFVKLKESNYGNYAIEVEDILCLHAQNHNTLLKLKSGTTLTIGKSIGEISDRLYAFSSATIVRISRSQCINIKYIDRIEGNMLVVAGTIYQMSSGYRNHVLAHLNFL